MLLNLLTKLEKVQVAQTREELEGVWRLRYQVHVEELKRKDWHGVDHKCKWIKYAEDEESNSTLVYTGTPEHMTSTARFLTWEPGKVPQEYIDLLSLNRIPGFDKLAISDSGGLVVRKEARGKLVLPALLGFVYELCAGKLNIDVAFNICIPIQIQLYKKFGARPYGGRIVYSGNILMVPMVLVLSDFNHFKKVGSLLTHEVKKYFGPGKRPFLDMTPFRHVLEDSNLLMTTEPVELWNKLETYLLNEENTPALFKGLSPKSLKGLMKSGLILNLEKGDELMHQGIKENEVYLILEGVFEVLIGDKQIDMRVEGDVMGEIAYFTQSGQRTATVKSLTPAKVFVLKRKFLKNLTKKFPEAGYQILMNLGQILAERLEEKIHVISSLMEEEEKPPEG